MVSFRVEDFTSHCPVTGQPDFAELDISYLPGSKGIIETKSLKMFLQRYRNTKQFNERIVDDIAEEIWQQAEAQTVQVTGRFALRGGIGVTASAVRQGLPPMKGID